MTTRATREGKPCKHCGGTTRFLDRKCIHSDRADHFVGDRERRKEQWRAWQQKHRDKYIPLKRVYYQNNKQYWEQYYLSNKPAYAASTARRRSALLNALPQWADATAISSIYDACPEGYEVDHIIPLQGKTVCGLHVPENLRIISRTENRSKGNRLLVPN